MRGSGLLMAEAGAGSWLWGWWGKELGSLRLLLRKYQPHPTPGANFQARGWGDAKEANSPVN